MRRPLKPSERADHVRRCTRGQAQARWRALTPQKSWRFPAAAATRAWRKYPGLRARWTFDDLCGVATESMVDVVSRRSFKPRWPVAYLLKAMLHDILNLDEKLRRTPEGNLNHE